MLTRYSNTTIQHPTEGVSFTIRKLAHYQVMMARDRRLEALARTMRALEGVTMPQPATPAEPPEPGADLDRMTVLEAGITGWSYQDPLNAESIQDLDETTAAWLFNEIVAFSFRTADEGKASANGSAPSTDQAEVVGLPS